MIRIRKGLLLTVLVVGAVSAAVLVGETVADEGGGVRISVSLVPKTEEPERPAWQEALLKKLDTRLSINFAGTPLVGTMRYFQEKGKINVILNDAVLGVNPDTPVVLRLDDVALRSAIAWTARLAGLVYTVKDEAVFVTTAGDLSPGWLTEIRARDQRLDLEAEKTWIPAVKARLEENTSFTFEDTALTEALGFLASLHKLNIVLDPRWARSDNTVSMAVDKMTAANALGWMLRIKGLDYTFIDEAIFVSSPAAIRSLKGSRRATTADPRMGSLVNLEFSETPLQEALKALGSAIGLDIALRADKTPEVKLTMKRDYVSLEQAVREIMSQTGLPFAFGFEDDNLVIWLQEPSAKKEPPEAPPESPQGQAAEEEESE